MKSGQVGGWNTPLLLAGDMEGVAVADAAFSAQHHDIDYLVMKRTVVEVRFPRSRSERQTNQPAWF